MFRRVLGRHVCEEEERWEEITFPTLPSCCRLLAWMGLAPRAHWSRKSRFAAYQRNSTYMTSPPAPAPLLHPHAPTPTPQPSLRRSNQACQPR